MGADRFGERALATTPDALCQHRLILAPATRSPSAQAPPAADGARARRVRQRVSLAVLLGYLLASFLYFGVALLVLPGGRYIGSDFADADIFIWSFAWWPHAIAHGLNPFVTHGVWAPAGANLTWVTSVPGLALVFAPLTYLIGPVNSYNVAAIAMPALSAWSAFILCRYLTRKTWPSVAGGYVFGFSPYVVEHAGFGHPNLTALFLLPLAALLGLRYLDRRTDGQTFVALFAVLLAFQLLVSTEMSATLLFALVVALAFAFAFASERRARLRALTLRIAVAYAVAGVLTGPFLYYLVLGYGTGGGFSASGSDLFSADLVNFPLPTTFSLAGSGLANTFGRHFADFSIGQEAYLGMPTLAVLGLFVWTRRRAPAGRFVAACAAVGLLLTLGEHAHAWGTSLTPLPWSLVHRLPLLSGIQTVRLVSYVTLLAAVAVALWTATRRPDGLRLLLPVLAVVALLPDPTLGHWTRGYGIPAFFTADRYRGCLDPGENVLPLPIGQGDAMIWQAVSGFRFSIAGGYLGRDPPKSFQSPPGIWKITSGAHLGAADTNDVRAFIAQEHVTSAVVAGWETAFFRGALDRLAKPQDVGGVLLYHFTPAPPSCF